MVPPSDAARSGSFATTPWSLLFAVRYRSHSTGAKAAVSGLCEIYWRPIYTFIANRGYDLYEAQDLTQSFMVYLIEREAFASADKARGKFRSYILGILKHYLAHAWRDERIQKRGGAVETVSLDEAVANRAEAPADKHHRLTPPHAIDRPWALALRARLSEPPRRH